jgi:hypothetical protein
MIKLAFCLMSAAGLAGEEGTLPLLPPLQPLPQPPLPLLPLPLPPMRRRALALVCAAGHHHSRVKSANEDESFDRQPLPGSGG